MIYLIFLIILLWIINCYYIGKYKLPNTILYKNFSTPVKSVYYDNNWEQKLLYDEIQRQNYCLKRYYSGGIIIHCNKANNSKTISTCLKIEGISLNSYIKYSKTETTIQINSKTKIYVHKLNTNKIKINYNQKCIEILFQTSGLICFSLSKYCTCTNIYLNCLKGFNNLFFSKYKLNNFNYYLLFKMKNYIYNYIFNMGILDDEKLGNLINNFYQEYFGIVLNNDLYILPQSNVNKITISAKNNENIIIIYDYKERLVIYKNVIYKNIKIINQKLLLSSDYLNLAI